MSWIIHLFDTQLWYIHRRQGGITYGNGNKTDENMLCKGTYIVVPSLRFLNETLLEVLILHTNRATRKYSDWLQVNCRYGSEHNIIINNNKQ